MPSGHDGFDIPELLDGCAVDGRFIVAVSGGSDSMALARLIAAHPDIARPCVAAVTIDHGLRRNSAQEARQAGAWCRAAGLNHIIKTWRRDNGSSGGGLQAGARAARYRLLLEAAIDCRADAILTAHTLDDRAETVLMRLKRGVGTTGLAAMGARRMIAAGAGDPVALCRPLLGVRRRQLQAYLEEIGQPFIDDPSNDDPAFERVRARALIAALCEQGLLSAEALADTSNRAAGSAAALDHQIGAAFKAAGGHFHRFGGVVLDRLDLAPPIAARLLKRLIYAVSGGEHPPNDESVRALIGGMADGSSPRATLGGALIQRAKAGKIVLSREPAALLGRAGVIAKAPQTLPPDARTLWDNRFIIDNRSPLPVVIRPYGEQTRAADDAADRMMLAAMRKTTPFVAAEAGGSGGHRPPAGDGAPPAGVAIFSLSPERFSRTIIRF